MPSEYRDTLQALAWGGASMPEILAGLKQMMDKEAAEREIEMKAQELLTRYGIAQLASRADLQKAQMGHDLGLGELAQKAANTASVERAHGKMAEAQMGAAQFKGQADLKNTLMKSNLDRIAQEALATHKGKIKSEATQAEENTWAPNLKTYSDITKKMPAPLVMSLIQTDPAHPMAQQALSWARAMSESPAEIPINLQNWSIKFATDRDKIFEYEREELAKRARKTKGAIVNPGTSTFRGLSPQEMQQPIPWENTLPGLLQGGLGNTKEDYWKQLMP